MRLNSTRRTVTIEEFSVQLDKADLAEIIEGDLADDIVVNPRDLTIHVGVGKQSIGATQILDMARTANKNIPEDAEVVIGIRWRREDVAASPIQRIIDARGPAGNSGVATATESIGAMCPMCGSYPLRDGPTPDCDDPAGCGMVRAEKGEIVIPNAVVPTAGPTLMKDSLTPPPGMLVNRETGQRAFMAKDGTPYGVHDDYAK